MFIIQTQNENNEPQGRFWVRTVWYIFIYGIIQFGPKVGLAPVQRTVNLEGGGVERNDNL